MTNPEATRCREPARVAILSNLKAETSLQSARKAHHRKIYDPHVPMTVSEFLARAWKLANDKARAGVSKQYGFRRLA